MDDLVPDPAHPQAFPSKYPLISGALFTLALPPLLWFLVLRVRRRRWRRAKQFLDDLTG
jgi:hypothetical protein